MCAYSYRFIGRKAPDTDEFHRHKALNIGDLHPSDVRSDQGKLALATFSVVPNSATRFLT
jgi:hypothetical protein